MGKLMKELTRELTRKLMNGGKGDPTQWQKGRSGQSLVEYLVIVALVAVGGIGIMRVVGQSVNVNFAKVASSLGARTEGRIEASTIHRSAYSKKNLQNFANGTSSGDRKNDQHEGD